MGHKDLELRRQYERRKHAEAMARWRAKQGEDGRSYYREFCLKKHYGLTIWDYDLMLLRQEGRCASCRVPFDDQDKALRPVIDHIHGTKTVRGILCCACNRTLGHAKEDPLRLRCCAQYLEERK